MARYTHDGKTTVRWVTTITDIAAPTVAQLNAGVDISRFIPKDGLNTPQNQNLVDSAALPDKFDAQVQGTWGGSLGVTGFRDENPDDDDLWNLTELGTNGFLVIRRGLDWDAAFAADQAVEVYPAEMGQPIPSATAPNEQARFTSTYAVTETPELKAVVAA